jgi:integrase
MSKTIMKNVMKTIKGKRSWTRYKKRSIIDVPSFVGWDILLSLIDACNNIDYDIYYRDYCRERDKGLIATLFETGGRVGEILSLTKANFDFTPKKYCVVSNMLLEKRYEKTGSYIEIVEQEPTGAHAKLYEPKLLENGKQVWTRKRWRTTITSQKVQRLRIRRPFPILKTEPLYPIMENYVNQNHSDLLFPSSRLRKNKTRFMTCTNAWIIINRIQNLTGIELWPHWFRSQRASQLKNEYGFSSDDRKDWFNWLSDPMAALYPKTSAQEMVAKMLRK